VSQCAVFPVHALESFALHWTQFIVVSSHTGVPVEHAPAPLVVPGMHPTQAPAAAPDGAQTCIPLHCVPPSSRQDATQV